MPQPFWTVRRYLPRYAVLSLELVSLRCPLCDAIAASCGAERTSWENGRVHRSQPVKCSNDECSSNNHAGTDAGDVVISMSLETYGIAAFVQVEIAQ